MAIFFTLLQVMEYFGVSYTITDSVFGSTFYMGTGFHGYKKLLLFIFIYFFTSKLIIFLFINNLIFFGINNDIKDKVDNNQNNSNLFLMDKDNNKFELDK